LSDNDAIIGSGKAKSVAFSVGAMHRCRFSDPPNGKEGKASNEKCGRRLTASAMVYLD
jgi:hypothetical protein